MSPLGIQSLPAAREGARRLAARLGLPCGEIAIHAFPDGEIRVTVAPASGTVIVYAPLDRPNDKLVALLFAAEALRRGGARRLVLVAPYLCYMRQDIAFRPGEAISQQAVGRLLAGCFERIVTVDAHLHRTAEIQAVFPGIEADNLSAMPAIAAQLKDEGIDPATVVVGPDAESEGWVRDLAGRLGLPHMLARKARHGDRDVEITLPPGCDLAGRPVLLADDMVSSGGTLLACARLLAAAGAARVDAVVTHALFAPEAAAGFVAAGIRSIRSTDCVPHPTNAITMDGILAEALGEEVKRSRM